MREALSRVKIPLVGAIAIVVITFATFAAVKPGTFDDPGWTITGNVVADDALFDAKITTGAPCADFDEPVCGADGETYRNLCFAVKAGTDMVHRGAC